MKKWQKIFFFALSFALICTLVLGITAIVSLGSSYIEIDTAEKLRKIGVDAAYPLDGDYKLTADIDLSDAEWTPLGELTGSFDGQGHVISGLHVGSSATPASIATDSAWGLFYALNGATVKNIIFENVYVNIAFTGTGNAVVGTVCGFIKGSSVIDSVAVLSGSLSATLNHQLGVAGIVGGFTGSKGFVISNCYNGASVNATSTMKGSGSYAVAAGIIARTKGYAANTVKNCLNVGRINAVDGGTSTSARDLSMSAQILNYQNQRDVNVVNPTTRSNNFGIDGVLSASGVKGAIYQYDVDNTTVVSLADAADSSKFSGLGSGWTLKNGYYPLPAALDADYAVPVGTAGLVISIETADELRKIGTNASYPMAGVYYRLMNDIDLSDANWIGAGYDFEKNTVTYFGGTFDGRGHVISNMHAHGATKNDPYVMPFPHWALFPYANSGAVVKNLAFDDIYFYGTAVGKNTIVNTNDQTNCAVAAVFGYGNVNLTVENVAVLDGSINVTCQRQTRVGGIVGAYNGAAHITLRNCFNGADITGNYSKAASSNACYVSAAGILGAAMHAGATYTIENCVNAGNINNPTVYASKSNLSSIGGIVARASTSLTPVTTLGTTESSLLNSYSVGKLSYAGTEGMHFPPDATGVTSVDVFEAENAAVFSGLTSGADSAWTVKAKTADAAYYPMLKTFVEKSVPVDIIYIDSVEELKKIGVDAAYPVTGDYKLTADLDLSGAEWTPIGGFGNEFTGVFNGGGHVISGMHIGTPTTQKTVTAVEADGSYNIGLFRVLGTGAQVYDLALKDVCLNAKADFKWFNAGALAGYARGGVTVKNVAVLSGLVSGMGQRQVSVGGVLGRIVAKGTTVENCFNAASVISTYSSTGNVYAAAAGIAGDVAYYEEITVKNCLNIGLINSLKPGSGASNVSSAGNIVATPRVTDPSVGLKEGSTLANSYAVSGTLTYQTGNYAGYCPSDKTEVAIVDLFSADNASKYSGLLADAAWEKKNGYYPMLKIFSDEAIAIDRDADLARLIALVDSIYATNYLTKADVEAKLDTLLSEYDVVLTPVKSATSTTDGEWKVSGTLSDGTPVERSLTISRLPAVAYDFELPNAGMAQGTVTVTLPTSYGGENYALAWGTENGLLPNYSYLTIFDELSISGNVLTYVVPDRTVIPAGATRLWVVVNDVPTAEFEIPAARRTDLGNLKYTFGLLSDTHFNGASVTAANAKAFTAAMNLFDAANATFAVVTGDITSNSSAAHWKGVVDTYAAGGWKFPVWVSAGNHDALEWNIDTANGLTPAQAIANMKAALGSWTYANENFTQDENGNRYKVTVSEENPDYDYTVQYGDDLFVYMGIGVYNSNYYNGGNKTNTSQHLDPSQLEWLEEVLDEYYSKNDVRGNVYLMFHYYTIESGFALMYDQPNGNKVEIDSGKGYIAFNEWSGPRDGQMPAWNSSELLWNLLKKYPNVIHFSGHSHRAFDDNESLSVTRHWKSEGLESDASLTWKLSYSSCDEDLGYTAVHVPSGQYYEGYIVNVYDTGVLITGLNTSSGENVSYANFFLPKELDTELYLRVNDGKIQYVKGYGEWLDLIKTDTLAPNAEIEVQTNGTHVQWRVKGQNEWKDLIALEDLDDLNGKMMQVGFSFENALTHLKYGDATMLTAVGGQSSGRLTYSVVSGPATVNPVTGLLEVTGLGEIVVKAFLGEDNEYVSAEAYVTIIGERRPITITADDQTKVYGAADPGLTYKVTTGTVVNNDVISGSLKYTGTNAGTYDIVEETAFGHDLYEITFVKGTMTITKKSVTVTADDQTKVYGAADPSLTYKVEGLVGTDLLTGTVKYTGTNVGTYDIVKDSGFENGNYDVTFVKGIMTITKKSVTVTADNQTKVYGATDPTLTYKVEGLVGTDLLTGTVKYTGTNVGIYDIVKDSGFENGNYDVTFVNGTMTITKKSVTVTADNQTKVYGAADPTLTYKVEGLVGTDTLTGTVKYTGTNVGTYDIVKDSGFENGNYDVTFVKGIMTITKKSVTVTVDNQTKVYGAADPTLTYKVEGLVGNDTLTGTLKYTGTNVGTYDIVKDSGFENGNYEVTFVKGTMTITPASTDSNQGGSSGITSDGGTTTDGDASSGNTGSAGNANTGDTGSGNPSTSDRSVLSFVSLLLACVASFVGVIWLTMRRKEN